MLTHNYLKPAAVQVLMAIVQNQSRRTANNVFQSNQAMYGFRPQSRRVTSKQAWKNRCKQPRR